MKEPCGVKILRTTPSKGWLVVYAEPAEAGRAKIERERISAFAHCEDEEGNRFVSGIGGDGELCVMRDDFVGHFSVKEKPIKIREAAMRFVRNKAQKRGEQL
ncbi:MAG TPA: hypothetical protein VK361_07330 [Rubrobacteraceae bacterium]|nr:hypothetical protein [Rubrobacteraceae bacterium]